MLTLSAKRLLALAAECGLDVRAIFPSKKLNHLLEKDKEYLERWQKKGYAGEMTYMLRSADIFCDAEHFLSNALSILSFSVIYASPGPRSSQERDSNVPTGFGRVARYAWGRDYHRVIKKKMKLFVEKASVELGNPSSLRFKVFSDAVPLLERAIAKTSGQGFIGRNTMHIFPGIGSYTFVAELLWNVEVEEKGEELCLPQLSKGKCGRCSRCLSICPTDALVASYELDARKCISYLTIEKKTSFLPWERQAIGSWIFGCDECQEICPFNHASLNGEEVGDFSSSRGCGPFLHLASLLRIRTREEFLSRFKGTPLMRAGREVLLRNAACVMANTSDLAGAEELIAVLKEDDSDLVKEHAKSALQNLYEIADGLDRRRIGAALA